MLLAVTETGEVVPGTAVHADRSICVVVAVAVAVTAGYAVTDHYLES
jgi:hypothetical protein